MKLFGLVLEGRWGWRGVFSGLSFEIFDPLFLFPHNILDLLTIVEQGIDADVGIVDDGMAALAVGFRVAGGVVVEAVQCDVFVEEDGVEGDHLFLGEVYQAFLQCFQLVDSALCGHGLAGRGRGHVGSAGLPGLRG